MTIDIRLGADQEEALRLRAAEEGVEPEALVRHAVDAYLARPSHRTVVREAAREQAAVWHELLERLK
ncbi:CopG family transcriptional regulator [Streptomyces sp. NPDC046887]|uniref:CopG family transcriptional regulator n=1 Tax=Streptomyces sp. NPDC046887 TaxID=3155472 RepID=UPI0033E66F91